MAVYSSITANSHFTLPYNAFMVRISAYVRVWSFVGSFYARIRWLGIKYIAVYRVLSHLSFLIQVWWV